MNGPKARLQKIADQLVEIGRTGKPMQAKLAELVDSEDLTDHEIQRVSEMANRGLQLEIAKVAEDQRFKFDLSDHRPLLRKEAKAAAATPLQELMGVSYEPPRPPSQFAKLSFVQAQIDDELYYDTKIAEARDLLQRLEQKRQESEALKIAGGETEVQAYDSLSIAQDKAVECAVELVMGGITFPSLYEAMYMTVSGSGATDDDRKNINTIALAILKGLQARGIPNFRLGFRRTVSVPDIEALSPEAILLLTKRVLGLPATDGFCDESIKISARYLEQYVLEGDPPVPSQLPQEANDYLVNRESQRMGRDQMHLDEKYTRNIGDNGGPAVVVNGDNEFVLAVKDMAASRDRLRRTWAAMDSIGTHLHKIVQAQQKTQGVIDEYGRQKQAWIQAALAAAPLVMGALGGKKKPEPAAAPAMASTAT